MPTESPKTVDRTDNHPDEDFYSHDGEVRALRRVLARLEARLDHEEEPSEIVRLAGAIARVSDSIVRALAAHHKLAALAQKGQLAEEWAALEKAREQQREDEEQRRRERDAAIRGKQEYWLQRVAEAAREAAEGSPAAAKEVSAGLEAYIASGNFIYAPDRYHLARLRNEEAARTARATFSELAT